MTGLDRDAILWKKSVVVPWTVSVIRMSSGLFVLTLGWGSYNLSLDAHTSNIA